MNWGKRRQIETSTSESQPNGRGVRTSRAPWMLTTATYLWHVWQIERDARRDRQHLPLARSPPVELGRPTRAPLGPGFPPRTHPPRPRARDASLARPTPARMTAQSTMRPLLAVHKVVDLAVKVVRHRPQTRAQERRRQGRVERVGPVHERVLRGRARALATGRRRVDVVVVVVSVLRGRGMREASCGRVGRPWE